MTTLYLFRFLSLEWKELILFTEKIILYNTTQSVVSKDRILFINGGDSLRGIGFWSDFDMENWKIEKPIGSIIKDEDEW